jgi:hypothetical protein
MREELSTRNLGISLIKIVSVSRSADSASARADKQAAFHGSSNENLDWKIALSQAFYV